MALLVAPLLGYLIGSFPTAYFLVKWKSNVDIRQAGSGNVGTLNSYEVTNSKLVGAIVLLIDLLKGIVVILLVKMLFGSDFVLAASAGVGAVVGHNFPLWLGFRGGRGLATAAGVMLMIAATLIPVWMAMWFVGKKFSDDVNVGNAVGTIAMLLVALLVPFSLLSGMIPEGTPVREFRIFVVLLSIVIGTRLVQPISEYVMSRKQGGEGQRT